MISKKEKARLEVRRLWVKACRHDGIPTGEKYVCLSPGNPFDKPYNKAMGKYLKIIYGSKVIGYPII